MAEGLKSHCLAGSGLRRSQARTLPKLSLEYRVWPCGGGCGMVTLWRGVAYQKIRSDVITGVLMARVGLSTQPLQREITTDYCNCAHACEMVCG